MLTDVKYWEIVDHYRIASGVFGKKFFFLKFRNISQASTILKRCAEITKFEKDAIYKRYTTGTVNYLLESNYLETKISAKSLRKFSKFCILPPAGLLGQLNGATYPRVNINGDPGMFTCIQMYIFAYVHTFKIFMLVT